MVGCGVKRTKIKKDLNIHYILWYNVFEIRSTSLYMKFLI